VLEFDHRIDLNKPNGVWIVESVETAEFVKLAETTYRDVNIGLANQFSIYATKIGVNIHEVIDSANSQNFSNLHRPGIAVGGHCIPIYPLLYLSSDPDASLVSLARRINAEMPSYAVDRLISEFGTIKGQRVLILGASYRSHVKETAYSGVFQLIEDIQIFEALPEVLDSLYPAKELADLNIPPFEGNAHGVKIAIVHNDDENYRSFLVNRDNFPDLEIILDGRGLFGKAQEVNGIRVISI
jgi:hypothetical protein